MKDADIKKILGQNGEQISVSAKVSGRVSGLGLTLYYILDILRRFLVLTDESYHPAMH